MSNDFTEKLYTNIIDEDEVRLCKDISDDQCTNLPSNFIKNSLNGISSKLAEQLASPSTVLPYLFSLVGVPASFTGFLVPVKNAGSLLPQLLVSARIRKFEVRKYFWVLAAIVQGFMIALIGWGLNGVAPQYFGILTLVALFFFSISSGVASVAFKDVMGKTIPKGNRGRLLATRATGGGILTIVAGFAFYLIASNGGELQYFQWLIYLAAALWILAAIIFASISETKGATNGSRSPLQEIKKGWSLFTNDDNFRNFLFVRGLLMAIPLALPFLIAYSREVLDTSINQLGFFVVVAGIANAISSPFWGRFSDRSSKHLMTVIASLGIAILLLAFFYEYIPQNYQNIYTYLPILFLITMAHGGARLGRKTYLVDYAPKEERPLYVAFANTVIGIFTLTSGLLGVVASLAGFKILLLVLIGLLIVAIVLSQRLQSV
jgi:MFS family permease